MVDRRHLPNSIPWAAAQLGISPSTMQRLVARGEVKVVEVNGLRRVPDGEIDRLQPVMGGGEHRVLQRLNEQAERVNRKRLEAEERAFARRQRLLKELRETS